MKFFGWSALITVGLAFLVFINSFYTVRQDEQALILEFGRPLQVINVPGEEDEAGFHWKMPWHTVEKLDRKNIGFDVPDLQVLASDQRRLVVDAFVRWQIQDPLQFYQAARTENAVRRQIASITDSAIRQSLGRVPVPEIISGQRSQLMNEIREAVNLEMSEFGVSVIDVRIRQADLPNTIEQGVYNRMRTARLQDAQAQRSEGQERALEIRARAERERTVLLAEAREQSEVIKGDGDAQRNAIYAEAYNQGRDFFLFQRGLIACETALTEGTRLVIDPTDMGICDQFIASARAASR